MNDNQPTMCYLFLDDTTGGFREITIETAEIGPGDRVIVLYRDGDRYVTIPGAS